MNAALARIILRYIIGGFAGAFVALGLLAPAVVSQITADKDVEMVVAMSIPLISGALVEVWYWLAKRWGWAT
jgi:hypothetical protein